MKRLKDFLKRKEEGNLYSTKLQQKLDKSLLKVGYLERYFTFTL